MCFFKHSASQNTAKIAVKWEKLKKRVKNGIHRPKNTRALLEGMYKKTKYLFNFGVQMLKYIITGHLIIF